MNLWICHVGIWDNAPRDNCHANQAESLLDVFARADHEAPFKRWVLIYISCGIFLAMYSINAATEHFPLRSLSQHHSLFHFHLKRSRMPV